MKKIFLFLLLLANAASSFSQDFLDNVSRKACQCAEAIPADTAKDNLAPQFGICIINAFSPSEKEQFQKEFNLSLKDVVKDGEKIGSIVGTSMATQCPAVILRISSTAKSTTGSATGVVTKIENDFFVVFSMRERNGTTSKFIWINQFPSKTDLPNTYQSLLGKNVEFKYDSRSIFDPKIGEYRQYKVLTEVK
ncbi:hypothetical protein [Undibacterium sp. TS12]|uniref:hypothetical protein n=1 Tax=Undibacterium sp. TS12 TaxID=2908202 RepID=UPI001F4C675E|nr:hypothetical protein [Undibacterium sp. TS12]MCH8619256.1 hypothetical protein [Undibacterium sp. TS12]